MFGGNQIGEPIQFNRHAKDKSYASLPTSFLCQLVAAVDLELPLIEGVKQASIYVPRLCTFRVLKTPLPPRTIVVQA